MKPFFQHFVSEIKTSEIYDNHKIDDLLDKICIEIGLYVIKSASHEFIPQGYTAIRILSESHIALHYWPENNFIHIDLVCCKKDLTIKEFEHSILKFLPNMVLECNLILYGN
jgi:S-adenosylmethionine/arginine decarboxylase-like enzyme